MRSVKSITGRAPALALLAHLAALVTASPALECCLKAASVPFHERDSDAWNLDVAPFNTRLPYLPAAIAVPLTTEHIEDAVKCAVKQGVKVSPKSGGHSYASLGLGGEDGHLIVQLDRMHQVRLAEDGTAFVQAGARLGHVAVELYDQGGVAMSHGTCPGVGIGGHVLHGGFGMSSFTHGLALDGMTAATVVLANGTTVRASSTCNPDLFWALRGSGSSFGIVSEFEFATFDPPPELNHFEVQLLWNDTESVVEGWSELQRWAEEEMPREMNMRFSVDLRGIRLDGMYHGSREEADGILEPLVERLGGGIYITNATWDWMGQLEGYAFSEDINLTYPYDEHENFYAKSLTTHALPRAAIEAFTNYLFTTASEVLASELLAGDFSAPDGVPSLSRYWWILIDIHGGANSRIAEIPHDSTSYAHRDKLLLFQFYDRVFGPEYPADEAEGFALLDGWVDSVTAELDDGEWGMYVNYADPRVEEIAEEVYFGENVARLREVKAAVDPEDVFHHPLGIKPASR